MTTSVRLGGIALVLILIPVLWVSWYSVASDYGDGVASGTYHLSQNGETATLVLNPNHTYQQHVTRSGTAERAEGSWRRIGEGGVAFSKEFLRLSGQELGADGTAYGQIEKRLGFLVSLNLAQYHFVWYGKTDSSRNADSVIGTYSGDEVGVPATLILKPDHTFEQTVTHVPITTHARGTWSTDKNGTIVFSKEFLKPSGEALRADETASALDPKGSNLQIEVSATSKSGAPTFRKKQFPW